IGILLFLFFFSSRRRHTIFSRDWSSDVCSSDLERKRATAAGFGLLWLAYAQAQILITAHNPALVAIGSEVAQAQPYGLAGAAARSEERRVGTVYRCLSNSSS